MTRILIIDDHPVVLQGLKGIISQDPALMVTGEAFKGLEALRKIRQESFDLAIMDFSLPDISGFDLLEEIKYIKPRLPVLVLSILPEAEYGPRVIQAGASGYLNKKYAAEEAIRAIKQVLCGKPYMSREVVDRLRARNRNGSAARAPELSNRELEVARPRPDPQSRPDPRNRRRPRVDRFNRPYIPHAPDEQTLCPLQFGTGPLHAGTQDGRQLIQRLTL